MSVRVFIEGGGNQNRTLTACRKAFSKLFASALGDSPKPKVLACGSRSEAFKDFRIALGQNPGSIAVLLVDSEGPVVTGDTAWQHLRKSDGWTRPPNATESQAHLMVQCMETWFLAEPAVLTSYYGEGFRSNALPRNPNIEHVSTQDIMTGMAAATRATSKQNYNKTRDGFEVLSRINPVVLRQRSERAAGFFAELERHSQPNQPRRR